MWLLNITGLQYVFSPYFLVIFYHMDIILFAYWQSLIFRIKKSHIIFSLHFPPPPHFFFLFAGVLLAFSIPGTNSSFGENFDNT